MLALTVMLCLAVAPPEAGRPYRPAPEAARPAPRVAASPAAGETLSDDEVRARAASYLERIDVPVTAAEWRVLGARAVPLLEEVATSSGALPSRRAAAMSGLGAIGGSRAQALLVETARSESEPFAVRAAAIRGAAGALSSPRLVEELEPVLERAKDPTARAAAAEALARRAPRAACAAIRAQADRELEGRARFERALGRCAAER